MLGQARVEGGPPNRVSTAIAIINYYSNKVSDCNMDSGEIVYATVDEVIGKTGKSPCSGAMQDCDCSRAKVSVASFARD